MRILVILHGMAAALSMAATIHLLILIPRRKRPPKWAAAGLLACLAVLFVLGWVAYPAFRTEVRFDLVRDPVRQWMANFFDVKEFLSYGALLGGMAAAAINLGHEPLPDPYRRAALWALGFLLFVLVFCSAAGITLGNYKIIS